jgi:hypothetical protein
VRRAGYSCLRDLGDHENGECRDHDKKHGFGNGFFHYFLLSLLFWDFLNFVACIDFF